LDTIRRLTEKYITRPLGGKQMGLDQSSVDEGGVLTEDDEDGAFSGPVRLRSEILLNEYRKLYEGPAKTASYEVLLLKDISKYHIYAL